MSDFQLERSTTIHAPAAVIYPYLVDLQRWQEWSPWEGLDPALERTYSEHTAGVGATYAWKGNRKAGQGTMAITEVAEPTNVTVALTFMKPMKAKNTVVFDLTEQDGVTDVRWSMHGPQTLAGRVFGVFVSIDKLVGKDFEKGLATLKERVEAAAA